MQRKIAAADLVLLLAVAGCTSLPGMSGPTTASSSATSPDAVHTFPSNPVHKGKMNY